MGGGGGGGPGGGKESGKGATARPFHTLRRELLIRKQTTKRHDRVLGHSAASLVVLKILKRPEEGCDHG